MTSICQVIGQVNSPNVPKKFTYQSVVRDSSGQLITNHNLRMRLSLQRAPQMTNLYIENHQLTTNSNGLLTCFIGSGQPTLGMMDTIDWSLGNVYIQTEIDLTGGNNFVTLGNQELLSVPYALYSLNSGSSTPGPQGPQGPQGPTGPTGSTGPTGPQGAFPSGTQPGEMNYWNGTNWVTVPPGNRGQALIFCDGIPVWGGCLPQVSTSPVVSIRGTATTGGNVLADGGVYVSVKGVVYDTFPSPTLASRYTINGSDTGSFTSELGLLISFISYYVRSYATNSVGTAYGNEVNFTSTNILPSVITEPVTFVNGIAKSGGNVLSDGGAFVTAKGVVYDTLPSPTLSNRFTIDGSDTGSFTCYLRELIVSTPYYLRSYATNSVGTAYGNQIAFTPQLAVGNIFGGGMIFYLDSSSQHGLVMAPFNQGNFEWGCNDTIVGTSFNTGTGQSNTNLILSGCPTRPIAASACNDLLLNGYSDWYLPSAQEFYLIYDFFDTNRPYEFASQLSWDYYWTSTEVLYDSRDAFVFHPNNRHAYSRNKNEINKVRAVRTF